MAAPASACAPDAALTRAAASLLSEPARPSPARLVEAAREAGSDLPRVVARVFEDGPVPPSFLRELQARWRAPLVCGEARSEGRLLVLVSPAAGRLEPAAEGRSWTVRLADGFVDARVEMRSRERVHRVRVRAGDTVSAPADWTRPMAVQLVASGVDGPRPLALRTLGESVASVVVESDEPLASRLRRLREVGHVGALRPNRLLSRVARRHAERTCQAGHVSHLDEHGDPEARLAREGIRARHVGETLSRASSSSRGWAGMLRSPSHRAALEDRRFTDVGIAEVEDGAGHVCQVVLLAAWPQAVPPQ